MGTKGTIRFEHVKKQNTQMSWDLYKSEDLFLEKITYQNLIVNKKEKIKTRILDVEDIEMLRLNEKEFDLLVKKEETMVEKIDDTFTKPKMLFIPIDQRDTLVERYKLQLKSENIKKEEERFKRERNNEIQKKNERTSLKAIEVIEKTTSDEPKEKDICTDDDLDEEGEFKCWKQREMERRHRDKNENIKKEE